MAYLSIFVYQLLFVQQFPMTDRTIFTDFLRELGVPFTEKYSDAQFSAMPFRSLFGMKHLMESYCIDSQGYHIADKSQLAEVPVPFIARMPQGLVIVRGVDKKEVEYLTQGVAERIPFDRFCKDWTGDIFCAYPSPESHEPDICDHRLTDFMTKFRDISLPIAAGLIFLYLFITNGLYANIFTILLILLNLAGIVFTVMLVQKSLNIHTKAADRVCGIIQEGGCDHVLATKAAKAFGIFGWSEVGLTYFSVSLLCLMIFPQYIPYLAAYNLLCLPFSFWSVWYQKYRAHHWCTLCLSVQATLWLLFACYLGGGFYPGIFPLRLPFFILGLTYFAVLMGLNKLMPMLKRPE